MIVHFSKCIEDLIAALGSLDYHEFIEREVSKYKRVKFISEGIGSLVD